MERTANRSGFKLRSGNSTPFKEIGARPIAPPKPGSSKEELMEIAGGFDVDVENDIQKNASMVTKEEIDAFLPMESEKLEILVDLLNGVYTVEAFKEDYQESLL